MPHKTVIEFKAKCSDLDNIREKLQDLKAKKAGKVRQIDYYFYTRKGRLKLRVVGGRGTLVYYERPDTAEVKESRVILVPIDKPYELLQALEAAVGVRTVVDKTREIWLLHGARVYLDSVDKLGTFVEVELDTEKVGEGRKKVYEIMGKLGIRRSELLNKSYGDMIIL